MEIRYNFNRGLNTSGIEGDINNPWTGEKTTYANDVVIPLNTVSDSLGTDLEIKIKAVDGDDSETTRYYTGWNLSFAFNYNADSGSIPNVTVKSARDLDVNGNINYIVKTQNYYRGSDGWNWTFVDQNNSNKISDGYNFGLLVHDENPEESRRLYLGSYPYDGLKW